MQEKKTNADFYMMKIFGIGWQVVNFNSFKENVTLNIIQLMNNRKHFCHSATQADIKYKTNVKLISAMHMYVSQYKLTYILNLNEDI